MAEAMVTPQVDGPASLGRVLVVDDDPDFAEGLDLLLADEGFEVQLAHSAAQAHERLESFVPDVALIDVRVLVDVMHGARGVGKVRPIARAQHEIQEVRLVHVAVAVGVELATPQRI